MSRNYDILRKVEKGNELFILPAAQPPPPKTPSQPSSGKPPSLGSLSQGREEIVKLVQRVFLAPGAGVPQIVVFSGVEPGSGSSSLCALAAEVLAAQGAGAVCLVDANLRRPSLHRWFGVSQEDGLTEAVFHPGPIQKYVRRVQGAAGPFLLTAGSPGSENHLFLNAERLQSRLMELRMEFSHILIDVSPVSSYADAQVVGALADGLVLVIEANVTRRESARKAKESLESAGVKILGAVLNNRTFPIPEGLYQKF